VLVCAIRPSRAREILPTPGRDVAIEAKWIGRGHPGDLNVVEWYAHPGAGVDAKKGHPSGVARAPGRHAAIQRSHKSSVSVDIRILLDFGVLTALDIKQNSVFNGCAFNAACP
jgi:hypothetical protein